MRFRDFLEDINATSARICERDAYVFRDVNVVARLTSRTLMRSDVLQYFDQLKGHSGVDLSSIHALIYYIVMYCYAVNAYPRPMGSSMYIMAARVEKRIKSISIDSRRTKVVTAGSRLMLPTALQGQFNALLDVSSTSGLFCSYSGFAPSKEQLKKLCAPAIKSAALLLYFGAIGEIPAELKNNHRIVYAGPIFMSPKFVLNGVYVGMPI